jgi:hypothetical protein
LLIDNDVTDVADFPTRNAIRRSPRPAGREQRWNSAKLAYSRLISLTEIFFISIDRLTQV